MNTLQKTSAKLINLTECMRIAEEMGYRENFKVSPRGMVVESKKYFYSPEETRIQNFYQYRSHLSSNNATLYLIETLDGKKGFLINDPGLSSDIRVTIFIKEVQQLDKERIRKRSFSWLTAFGGYLKTNIKPNFLK